MYKCVTRSTHTCDMSVLQCVLQCIAVCCSVLQCVAVCCSVLQYVAVCCGHIHVCGMWASTCVTGSTHMYVSATHCDILQHTASIEVFCSVWLFLD